jgi:hypothetical protein
MRPGHQIRLPTPTSSPRSSARIDPRPDLLLAFRYRRSPYAAAVLHTAAEENHPLDFQPSMTGHVSHHHHHHQD